MPRKKFGGVIPTRTRSPKGDLYETPEYVVHALLAHETFRGGIWEPACGKGRISRVLIESGFEVISSDLYDWGFGKRGIDFLKTNCKIPNIITNPPFSLGLEFILHGVRTVEEKLALLFPLTYLSGQERFNRIYRVRPPTRVLVFIERVGFLSGGVVRKGIDYAWFIWDKGEDEGTRLSWIHRTDRRSNYETH